MIKPYNKNAKKHPDKQLKLIAKSLKEFGCRQPIVVDKDDVIIVGHGRWLAYQKFKDEYNLTEPKIERADDLTPKQVKAYRLADNKLNESDWDMDLAIEDLKDLDDNFFELTGFDADLLLEPDDKDDEVPDVPEEATAKLGDIYQLGNHRVMCGDSTKIEDVEKLMDGKKADMVFTDPPYNVDYGVAKNPRHKIRSIENDKQNKEEWIDFNKKLVDIFKEFNKGDIYVWGAPEQDGMKQRLLFCDEGIHWSSTIVWVKQQLVLSPAKYQRMYELCFYGWVDKSSYCGDRTQTEVWEDLRKVKTEYDGENTIISFQGFKVKIKGKVEKGEVIRKKQRVDIWRHDRPNKSDLHPTMKPLTVCLEGITNSSQKGNIVLDLFLGSGSTLIACEKTNRICYSCELDPKYVDVIITRYCEYTGNYNIIRNGEPIVWQKKENA